MNLNPESQPGPEDKWWREIYYENFAVQKKKMFPLTATSAEWLWHNLEGAAWVYELVRRSPNVVDSKVRLPGYETWPSFPGLNVSHRVALTNVVEMATGYRLIVTVAPTRTNPPKPGYSESFPGYSFDLLADDQPLTDTFMAWIQNQRGKFGHLKPKGSKGLASHNRRELPKTLDWRLVEVLEHKKGQGAPLTDTERGYGRDARHYAKRFRDLVISTIDLSDQQLKQIMQSLLKAHPGMFGELTPENLDFNTVKADMTKLETMLFGSSFQGSDSGFEQAANVPLNEVDRIIRRFRKGSKLK
jgi:hypothetical protein